MTPELVTGPIIKWAYRLLWAAAIGAATGALYWGVVQLAKQISTGIGN